jgi:hypothetical protein
MCIGLLREINPGEVGDSSGLSHNSHALAISIAGGDPKRHLVERSFQRTGEINRTVSVGDIEWMPIPLQDETLYVAGEVPRNLEEGGQSCVPHDPHKETHMRTHDARYRDCEPENWRIRPSSTSEGLHGLRKPHLCRVHPRQGERSGGSDRFTFETDETQVTEIWQLIELSLKIGSDVGASGSDLHPAHQFVSRSTCTGREKLIADRHRSKEG